MPRVLRVVIQAWMLSGIVYNIIGATVCFLFSEFDLVGGKLASLSIFVALHLLHKKMGTY